MIPVLYFSVSVKFGASYITGQWGDFRLKNLIYVFIYFFALTAEY